MKNLMTRALCALIAILTVASQTYADNSVNTTTSDLSSVSVKIGAKSYSGTEAKTLLVSRVKTMENMRKTADDKKKFLEQFVAKLSKLSENYEKRGGKAGDLAKVLRAIESELKSEISALSGGVATFGSGSTNNNAITQTSPAISSVGSNVGEDLRAMLTMAKTPIQTFYINVLYSTVKSSPSTGWKSQDEAVSYMFNKFGTSYNKYPKTLGKVIEQAVMDGIAGKVGTPYLENAFKALPKDFSADTVSQNTTSGEPVNVSVGSNVNRSLNDMKAMAKTPIETFYVNVLYSMYESRPENGWKDRETAIKYMVNKFGTSYNKYPKTLGKVIEQAVDDGITGKIGVQNLNEALKALPKDFSADTVSQNTTSDEPVNVSVGSNVNRSLNEMMAMTKTQQEIFYVKTVYDIMRSSPSTGWKDKETAIKYQLDSNVSAYKKYPVTIKAIIIQSVDDVFSGRVGVKYLEEAFKTLPKENK